MRIEFNRWSKKENQEKTKGRVSYSQYSMYKSCPRRWKLSYIDKIKSGPGLAMTFGTAMHEVLQTYLYVCHTQSAKDADALNLYDMLIDELKKTYVRDRGDGEDFATPEELEDFANDGIEIIGWLKKHRSEFFRIKDYELIGIELPINYKILDDYDVNITGYLDLVFREISTNTIFIIDIKTSYSGWNKYQKADKTKTSQLVLYKKYFSEQYGHPVDKIDVSYYIVKRKVPENAEFANAKRRLQKFSPANGKVTLKKVINDFTEFVTETHTPEGERITDREYPAIANSGKNCKWCIFKDMHELCDPKDRK